MDLLFLVVDSLRAQPFADGRVAATPFLDGLRGRWSCFSQAYATDCWTLPSHASMFTGLMPSEHGAHFQNLAYGGRAPTLAELLSAAGYETELVTRNFVFDGTIPGIARGFARRTRVCARRRYLDPTALLIAASKPRFRRHLRNTGFFPRCGWENGGFLARFAASLYPADERLLAYLVRRLRYNRRRGRRSFLFANLYDVHAPYPPRGHSLTSGWRSWNDCFDNFRAPWALSRLGEHRYLKRGFAIPDSTADLLRRRYRAAVQSMDEKLAHFFDELSDHGLLDETAIVLTSDHGEGFGEHGLFLHDGSLFDTHVRVPLWLFVPGQTPSLIERVVSTRHLAETVLGVLDGEKAPAILSSEYVERHGLAFAQHYRYPHLSDVAEDYTANQFAAVSEGGLKVVRRAGRWLGYDRRSDRNELSPVALADVAEACEFVGAGLPADQREREAVKIRRLEVACA